MGECSWPSTVVVVVHELNLAAWPKATIHYISAHGSTPCSPFFGNYRWTLIRNSLLMWYRTNYSTSTFDALNDHNWTSLKSSYTRQRVALLATNVCLFLAKTLYRCTQQQILSRQSHISITNMNL